MPFNAKPSRLSTPSYRRSPRHAFAALGAVIAILVGACVDAPSAPPAQRQLSGLRAFTSSSASWGPETPHFNLEVILRNDEGGFGHVKFRQPNDAQKIVNLDVWVRDLEPNTSYQLQRATDANVNDDCTGGNWLTLGRGTTPAAIVTDDRGTARAELFRDLSATPVGTTFDIHFRVVRAGTTTVVLDSECYQFTVDQ
jgi:hypothetical protein